MQIAQAPITMETIAADISTGRVLIMSYLIFIMQTGFGLLEAGACRQRNVSNVLLKNVTCISLSVLVWLLWGFAAATGGGPGACGDNPFVGHSWYLLLGDFSSVNWSVSVRKPSAISEDSQFEEAQLYAYWVYSWAFSATATAVIGGAIAERTQFRVYAMQAVLMTGLVYPFVEYWVWSSSGWLSSKRIDCASGDVVPLVPGSNGVLDFAGGLVVHVVGGMAALYACILVGPRLGRYNSQGHIIDFTPHNPTHMVLGALVLWFGFFAFNTGFTGCIVGCAVTASRAAVNTSVAGGSGALTSLLLAVLVGHPGDVYQPLYGLLTALVSITAPCGFVQPYAALVIGSVGGAVYLAVSSSMKRCHVDDVVDAVAVHLGGGLWGSVAVGLFATQQSVEEVLGYANTWGLFYGGGWLQLGMQLLGIVAACLWCTLWVWPFFWLLRKAGWLRVSAAEEQVGCDFAQSVGTGFSLSKVVQWMLPRQRAPKSKCSDLASSDAVGSNERIDVESTMMTAASSSLLLSHPGPAGS